MRNRAGNTKHETCTNCSNTDLIVTVSCCFSDDSELSDNEEEPLPKGEEGLLNGGTDGMVINGSLSRDGEFHLQSICLCKLYSASVSMYMYAWLC